MRALRTRRSRAWLLALFRAAFLVVVFHLSGFAHLVADVHEIVITGHHAGTPFDHDDDAPSQAPGSPTCHHAQPGAASLASPSFASLDLPESARLGIARPVDRVSAAPEGRSVYRPPRA